MKKQNKQTDKFKKITIFFGYVLFALLLVAVTISTIMPMGLLFFNPAARHFNVAVLLTSLVAGVILPPLISYLIGDRATHSKSKIDHHFNGVLFGIASYWLSMFFFFIGSDVISDIRSKFAEPLATAIAGWPILATLAVVAIVAVGYVTSKKKQTSVLDYKPYLMVLFAGLMATFAYILLNQIYVANASWVISVLYVIIPAALVGASYKVLPVKNYTSTRARLAGAVVAVSIGYIASSIAGQLIYLSNMAISIAIGVATLVLYLVLIRRSR